MKRICYGHMRHRHLGKPSCKLITSSKNCQSWVYLVHFPCWKLLGCFFSTSLGEKIFSCEKKVAVQLQGGFQKIHLIFL